MFDATTLITFFMASAAIVMIPGPAQAMVLARTLSHGRRAGVFTALGLNIGTLVHAMAAGLGVSAVLATSASAFVAVKSAGATYLIYLGVQAWREDRRGRPVAASGGVALGNAIVTGILNPKVAIFFLAFLPQFVQVSRGSVFAQCVVLGVLLATLDVLYETILVTLAARMADALRVPRVQRWRSRCTGAVLVGLGLRLALAERR